MYSFIHSLNNHTFLACKPSSAATKLYLESLALPLALAGISSKSLTYLHQLVRLLQPNTIANTIKHIKSLVKASHRPLLSDLSSILTTNGQRTMWLLDAYFLSTLEEVRIVPFDLATFSIDVSQQQLQSEAHLKLFLDQLPDSLVPDVSIMRHIVTVSQGRARTHWALSPALAHNAGSILARVKYS